MSYLVRKLNKIGKLHKLSQIKDIYDVTSDIPTGEFRTTDDKLSTWEIDTLGNLDEAVLAIATTSSKLTKMDFIVIATDILNKNNIEYKKTPLLKPIPIIGLNKIHCDLVNIIFRKLYDCCLVYKEIEENDPDHEMYIRRYSEGEIKDLVKKAIIEKRVDIRYAEEKMREEIELLEKK